MPFRDWIWDSRRALAIKGKDEGFRKGMVEAYRAMAEHMPDNGLQIVMFTHQDAGVWADMAEIMWGAGLQVTAAWYIATETTSETEERRLRPGHRAARPAQALGRRERATRTS